MFRRWFRAERVKHSRNVLGPEAPIELHSQNPAKRVLYELIHEVFASFQRALVQAGHRFGFGTRATHSCPQRKHENPNRVFVGIAPPSMARIYHDGR